MEFQLLGKVAVLVDGRALDLGPDRQSCVLVALAVDAGRVVSVERLIERVWGEAPPPRARATLTSYLSRLRGLLAGVAEVARRPGGYVLEADRAVVDLHRFRDLRARARAGAGDDRVVAEALEQALVLWRGEALTGLGGDWAAAERDRLHQERLEAECDLTDALLRLGHGDDLVADLSVRTAERPLDERVAGQYMVAVHRAGRTADALAHYRRLRERLVGELGIDPGTALQELHRQILAADPALTAASRTTAAEPVVAPRQLPAAPGSFVGRRDDLDRLDATLRDTVTTVVITAIAGAGGIGKTWLALHWAHRHLDRFPDGQLFVDLRGFAPEGEPMDSSVVVRGFLDAMGVRPDRVPADPHAQVAMFRSLMADKRMLLVLDNAAGTDQVLPLLPGSATCTVVVTSRNQLSGLITRNSGRHLPLDVLPEVDARALLTDRLGAARVVSEPAAVDELIRACGGFPLALSIVAGHAHTRPRLSLASLAAELRDLGLDALDDDSPAASLPSVLSWSLRALGPEQLETFALLGIAPGADIGPPAAANLTGLPPNRTRAVLRGLEQASLINQDAHGRYRMHDLIRAYAAEVADRLPENVRNAALRRVLDFYAHTADAADRLLDPHRLHYPFDPPAPDTFPQRLADAPAALEWFDAEHANILASQHIAVGCHRHDIAWHLARTLTVFHLRRGYLHDELAVWQIALEAATRLPTPGTLIRAHRRLGRACADLGRTGEAIAHLDQALVQAEHHHDLAQQAHTEQTLARAWEQHGDQRQALRHAKRAVELFRALDQPVWTARALSDVGWFAALVGDYDTARTHCEAAIDLYRHHGWHEAAATLDSLGYIEHHSGHHDRAIHHFRHALAQFRQLDNTYDAADTLDRLGHPHVALGQHDQARAVWEEALELYLAQERAEDAERVRRQLRGA